MGLTQTQIENIQIDYGIVFTNYGEVNQTKLGPSRGGGEFSVDNKIRDIEYDGQKGKTKGMQVNEEVNASLKVTILDMSIPTLALAMPYATLEGDGNVTPYSLTCKNDDVGIVDSTSYLKNITMFCKTVKGAYKKITLYNAMSESKFGLKAKPKGEGEVELEFNAHWDVVDDTANLFKVEDAGSIIIDTVKPTVITIPADAATAIVVSSTLSALFSEDVKVTDINAENFILIKASDGSVIAGALNYTIATKTATFNPTVSLTAATPYIWLISRVKDNAGNIMLPIITNFTTA